jgi:hypothetical protein
LLAIPVPVAGLRSLAVAIAVWRRPARQADPDIVASVTTSCLAVSLGPVFVRIGMAAMAAVLFIWALVA